MALGLSAAEANAFLDALVAEFPWIKLHVGDPGAAGTATPAAETDRMEASFAAATGGTITTDAALVWASVAGGEDYTHFSAWTLAAAGTFGFSGAITANAVLIGDTFTIPAGDLDIAITVAA